MAYIFFAYYFSMKAGNILIIKSVKENCKMKDYLVSCGFVSGARLEIMAVSPLKKSFLVSVSNSVITLKSSVLEDIEWHGRV